MRLGNLNLCEHKPPLLINSNPDVDDSYCVIILAKKKRYFQCSDIVYTSPYQNRVETKARTACVHEYRMYECIMDARIESVYSGGYILYNIWSRVCAHMQAVLQCWVVESPGELWTDDTFVLHMRMAATLSNPHRMIHPSASLSKRRRASWMLCALLCGAATIPWEGNGCGECYSILDFLKAWDVREENRSIRRRCRSANNRNVCVPQTLRACVTFYVVLGDSVLVLQHSRV